MLLGELMVQMEQLRARYLQILKIRTNKSRNKQLQMMKFFVLFRRQALVLFPMMMMSTTHLLSLLFRQLRLQETSNPDLALGRPHESQKPSVDS
jgi:hypothetical protein